MSQMKEQDTTPEEQLNEVEIENLSEKYFRVTLVRMIQDFGKKIDAKIDEWEETFKKGIEDLKIQQAEMINTITEIKNSLEENSTIQEAEDQKSEVEDRLVEITDVEQNKEKRKKRIEDSLEELWDNFKCPNIRIIGVWVGKERDKGPEKIFEEIITENFPNMGEEILTQIQEAQRIPYRINPRRNTRRHILIKLSNIKVKEQILKATNNIQGNPHKVISWFFSRNSVGQKGVAWYI